MEFTAYANIKFPKFLKFSIFRFSRNYLSAQKFVCGVVKYRYEVNFSARNEL